MSLRVWALHERSQLVAYLLATLSMLDFVVQLGAITYIQRAYLLAISVGDSRSQLDDNVALTAVSVPVFGALSDKSSSFNTEMTLRACVLVPLSRVALCALFLSPSIVNHVILLLTLCKTAERCRLHHVLARGGSLRHAVASIQYGGRRLALRLRGHTGRDGEEAAARDGARKRKGSIPRRVLLGESVMDFLRRDHAFYVLVRPCTLSVSTTRSRLLFATGMHRPFASSTLPMSSLSSSLSHLRRPSSTPTG